MKMSVRSPARQQSVFQQYHSENALPEFYPQDGGESQLASKLRHCRLMYTSHRLARRKHARKQATRKIEKKHRKILIYTALFTRMYTGREHKYKQ